MVGGVGWIVGPAAKAATAPKFRATSPRSAGPLSLLPCGCCQQSFWRDRRPSSSSSTSTWSSSLPGEYVCPRALLLCCEAQARLKPVRDPQGVCTFALCALSSKNVDGLSTLGFGKSDWVLTFSKRLLLTNAKNNNAAACGIASLGFILNLIGRLLSNTPPVIVFDLITLCCGIYYGTGLLRASKVSKLQAARVSCAFSLPNIGLALTGRWCARCRGCRPGPGRHPSDQRRGCQARALMVCTVCCGVKPKSNSTDSLFNLFSQPQSPRHHRVKSSVK